MESISSSQNHDCVAAATVASLERFPEAASTVAVMWEQMEFLVAHGGPACSPDCPACARLEQVTQCLLRPFGHDGLRRPD
jgi:hypothetical protein